MPDQYKELKEKVLVAAKACAKRGPGYSQQRPVFDMVASETAGGVYTRLDLDLQQAILTCWHDLFREGTLSWGYDLDNPDPPFFHIPDRNGPQEQPRHGSAAGLASSGFRTPAGDLDRRIAKKILRKF